MKAKSTGIVGGETKSGYDGKLLKGGMRERGKNEKLLGK